MVMLFAWMKGVGLEAKEDDFYLEQAEFEVSVDHLQGDARQEVGWTGLEPSGEIWVEIYLW
jgi:hypothetical protein